MPDEDADHTNPDGLEKCVRGRQLGGASLSTDVRQAPPKVMGSKHSSIRTGFSQSSLVQFLKFGISKQPNTLRKTHLSRNQLILSKLVPSYRRVNVAFPYFCRTEMSRSSRNRHQHECQYSGCKERQVKVRYENHSTRIRSRYCPDRRLTFTPTDPGLCADLPLRYLLLFPEMS
jgi:hypothetical protein